MMTLKTSGALAPAGTLSRLMMVRSQGWESEGCASVGHAGKRILQTVTPNLLQRTKNACNHSRLAYTENHVATQQSRLRQPQDAINLPVITYRRSEHADR